MEPNEAKTWLDYIGVAMDAALSPPVMVVLLAIFLTQIVKVFDHAMPWVRNRKPPELDGGEIRMLAWGITVVLCFGWYAGWIVAATMWPDHFPGGRPDPRMMFVGIPAGLASILLPIVAKSIHPTLDLDLIIKDRHAPEPPQT